MEPRAITASNLEGPLNSHVDPSKQPSKTLPGAQKYVKESPFRLFLMVLGHHFRYFGGPGLGLRKCRSPCLAVLRPRQAGRVHRRPGRELRGLKKEDARLQKAANGRYMGFLP